MINSPRGEFVESLKRLISKLKAEVESTQSDVETLERDFEELEAKDKEKASDTLKLMQGRLADLIQQLSAAQRIHSRGFK